VKETRDLLPAKKKWSDFYSFLQNAKGTASKPLVGKCKAADGNRWKARQTGELSFMAKNFKARK